MSGSPSKMRMAIVGLGTLIAVSGAVQAQGRPVAEPPQSDRQQDQQKLQKIAAAAEKWLATDQTSEDLMAKTVGVVLEDSTLGLAWLGKQLPSVDKAPNTPRSKGLRTLCTQSTLEFLRRTNKADMVFVGQYNDLRALQPFAGNFLFELLLETPDWYPYTFRVRLVPAIRDVQLRLPESSRVDGIVALIEDERESDGLRNALAAMMAQWGRPKYADAVIKRLRAATMEGDGEDRVGATLTLADYYNYLRDYENAARTHRTAQALAKGAQIELRPIAWYASACVHALHGDLERGMQSLERCARMHASPDLDSSLRLSRKLFEKDPEIALLRKDKRFAGLLKLAFGAKKEESQKEEPKKDGR